MTLGEVMRLFAGTALVGVVAAGCSGAVGATPAPGALPQRLRPTGSVSRVAMSASPRAARPVVVAAPAPGWTPLTRDRYGVVIDRRMFRVGPGISVVVMRFRAGQSAFVLHAGSVDPGWRAYRLGVSARSAIRGRGRSRLVAAFTGGFYLSTGSGGYVQERQVVAPLRPGLASLVIDSSGAAHVVSWSRGLRASSARVFSVRQNLPALVIHGHPSALAGDVRAWGATLGGGSAVARCALGEDASGNLLFAAAMSVTPAELATALVRAGARTAMQLDINPEWVQFDYAHFPGGHLTAGVPGQYRPADQYLVGWTRDFIAVEAPRRATR